MKCCTTGKLHKKLSRCAAFHYDKYSSIVENAELCLVYFYILYMRICILHIIIVFQQMVCSRSVLHALHLMRKPCLACCFSISFCRLGHVAEVGIAMVVLMGLAFIPSRVIVYVVNERIRDEKQVQSISGVGTLLYWTTTFIWDMGIVLATVALSALIILAFGLPVYVSKLNFPAVLLLMILFG